MTMVKTVPMIPKEVWNEVQDTIATMRASLEGSDNEYAMDEIITREVFRVLKQRGCLKEPADA